MDLTRDHYNELEGHLYPAIYNVDAALEMPDERQSMLIVLNEYGLLNFTIMNDNDHGCNTRIVTTPEGCEVLRLYRDNKQARAQRYLEEALF